MGGDAERKVKVAELSLRAVVCALGAAAAALVGTDSETRTFFSFQKTASFTDMKAMVFLVAATAAAAGYSLLMQAARCCCLASAARRPFSIRFEHEQAKTRGQIPGLPPALDRCDQV